MMMLQAAAQASQTNLLTPNQVVIFGVTVVVITAYACFKIFNEVWKPFERRIEAERVATLHIAKTEAAELITMHEKDESSHIMAFDERYTPRKELAETLRGMQAGIDNVTRVVVDTRNLIIAGGDRRKEPRDG